MTAAKTDAIEKRKAQLRELAKALKEGPLDPEDERYYPFHEAPGNLCKASTH
jgi:hypothetical protein